jgi:hypothetical protein
MDHVLLRNPAQLKSWYQEESESEQPEESVGLAGHGVDIGGDLKYAVLNKSCNKAYENTSQETCIQQNRNVRFYLGKKGERAGSPLRQCWRIRRAI